MDRTTVAILVALSLVAVTVSADHGEPAPITVEKVYEVGLIGDVFGFGWNHPIFQHVTEDGSASIALVGFQVPHPDEATHPPTVQVQIDDRVLEGDVAGKLLLCVSGPCPDSHNNPEFCGTSEAVPVDAEVSDPDWIAVKIYGPVGQDRLCPDSDNPFGGIQGTVTATFSWD